AIEYERVAIKVGAVHDRGCFRFVQPRTRCRGNLRNVSRIEAAHDPPMVMIAMLVALASLCAIERVRAAHVGYSGI
ncbi:MAG TPA: hypothetical protein VIG47_15455, partial [Gemmatimonadaceae bacterium]